MTAYFFTVRHWFRGESGYCVYAETQAEAWAKLIADNETAELTSAVLFDMRAVEGRQENSDG